MMRMGQLLFVLFLVISMARAQEIVIDKSILTEETTSPRAAAMGRAYTALANDCYSMSYNPAGLARFEKSMATISGKIRFGNASIDPPQLIKTNKSYKIIQAGSANLDFVGFVIPLPTRDHRIVTSLALQNLADLNDNMTLTTMDNNTQATLDETTHRSGGLYALSIGLGTEIISHFRLGISIDVITGQQVFENRSNFTLNDQEIKSWEKWENKFSGVGLNFGFQWAISDQIALGSRITFPYTIHYADIKQTDSNGNERSYENNVSLSRPLTASFGLAVFPLDNLTFSFDYWQRTWEKSKTFIAHKESGLFANANSFHMGFEYVVNGNNFRLPWRIGFFTSPEQIWDYNAKNPELRGKQISSHYITGGIGVLASNFLIDFSLDYQILQYKFDMGIADNPFGFRQSRYSVRAGLQVVL